MRGMKRGNFDLEKKLLLEAIIFSVDSIRNQLKEEPENCETLTECICDLVNSFVYVYKS